MKEKRILVVIDSLGYGGAERLLASLLPRFNQKYFKFDVVVLFQDLSLKNEIESNGINVLEIGGLYENRWSIFKILYRLKSILNNNDYDIIWGHLFFGNIYSALSGYFFPKLKVYWTLHSPVKVYKDTVKNGISYKAIAKYKIRFFIENLLGNNKANKIIAVSHAVANEYKDYYGWKFISVIHNGVDFSTFPSSISKDKFIEVRKKYQVDRDTFLIVTPGRYAPEKGHEILIEALVVLCSQYNIRAHWITAGSGPEKDYIQKLLHKGGIGDNATLLDVLPHVELLELMQSSDLVVIPSLREPFGIVAVESMGLGVPTLVSNVDGLVEVVGHNSLHNLVEPGDSVGLVKSIHFLYNNREIRNNLAVAGKNRAYQTFSIQNCVDKWEKILN
jgi:glycosyltransferase involved in cell wall biosynthesis